MVEVLEHDVGVFTWIIQIEEPVGEVLLVVLWVDEREQSRLTTSGRAVHPEVRVPIARELGSERRETVRSLSVVGAGDLTGLS